MIFVTLGTQDRSFKRLLEAIDKAINNKEINDQVIVQKGNTKYESNNMELYDFLSNKDFNDYLNKADIVITHGGVGSICEAIKLNKKVIAAARLKEYYEHQNDHQVQIVKRFKDEGYILALEDFNELGKIIKEAETFVPKRFESNTDNFIKYMEGIIDQEINEFKDNHLRIYLFYLIIIILIALLIKLIIH